MDGARNADGTYNGVKALSTLSGLSELEIAWALNRAKQLREQGFSKDFIARALSVEMKRKFGKEK